VLTPHLAFLLWCRALGDRNVGRVGKDPTGLACDIVAPDPGNTGASSVLGRRSWWEGGNGANGSVADFQPTLLCHSVPVRPPVSSWHKFCGRIGANDVDRRFSGSFPHSGDCPTPPARAHHSVRRGTGSSCTRYESKCVLRLTSADRRWRFPGTTGGLDAAIFMSCGDRFALRQSPTTKENGRSWVSFSGCQGR
jgi:hypothetical protein